jgi:hypothetical protein
MFLIGPLFAEFSGATGVITESLLPTVLPLIGLVIVANYSFRVTHSWKQAAGVTAGALVLGMFTFVVYLLIVWADASGS